MDSMMIDIGLRHVLQHLRCAAVVIPCCGRQLEMDEISVKLSRDAQQVEEEKSGAHISRASARMHGI